MRKLAFDRVAFFDMIARVVNLKEIRVLIRRDGKRVFAEICVCGRGRNENA